MRVLLLVAQWAMRLFTRPGLLGWASDMQPRALRRPLRNELHSTYGSLHNLSCPTDADWHQIRNHARCVVCCAMSTLHVRLFTQPGLPY
jgi:hypothetical protein